jgi:hypothetical protein
MLHSFKKRGQPKGSFEVRREGGLSTQLCKALYPREQEKFLITTFIFEQNKGEHEICAVDAIVK